jgi:hypothetical protein
MPGRQFSSNSYRYGFGGHEKDDEVKGTGNHLSFGDYGYDTRLGRRWRTDPLAHEMPSWSPYSTFLCNPIRYVDVDGRKPGDPPLDGNKTKVQKTTSDNIIDFGKVLVEGFVDPLTFTTSSILSGVGNTFLGVSKKAERIGLVKTLDDGGIDVLSKKERFSPIGFSFKEGFKKEDPNFSEIVPLEDGKRIMKGTVTVISAVVPTSGVESVIKTVVGAGVKKVIDAIPDDKKKQQQQQQENKSEKQSPSGVN